MIPKIIHYCWFGESMPENVKELTASWKEKLPDYEFRLWTSQEYNIQENRFIKEAYEKKMYAFVSDYVRLDVLYTYGGIYLDTDVEILKSFNPLCNQKGFIGFETSERLGTCVIGAEAGNPVIGRLLDYYKKRSFIADDGTMKLKPNTEIVTENLKTLGLQCKNQFQTLENFTIYPMTYFSPLKMYREEEECFSEDTYSIHYFNASWKAYKKIQDDKHNKERQPYIDKFGKFWGVKIYCHSQIIRNIGIFKWFIRHVLRIGNDN